MIDLLSGAEESLFRESSIEESKALFSKYVDMVEVEAFSYCNRDCWFCPNSFIDRRSSNTFLETEKYEALLQGLSDINYRKLVSFSRYNEPFSSDKIYSYAALARKYLPEARIHTNTNGDYMSMKALRRAHEAGFNSVCIQIYLPKDRDDIPEEIESYRQKILKRIPDLDFKPVRMQETWHEYQSDFKGMDVRLRWRNFKENGTNRAGIKVSNYGDRVSPCTQPINKVFIDYNGKSMPCCNLRSDLEAHEHAILGELTEDRNSIFSIYGSRAIAGWRKGLSGFGPKGGVCKTCRFGEAKYEALGKLLIKRNRERLELAEKLERLEQDVVKQF